MRSFLGDPFRKRFRIQRYLVRQWIHVCVSSRGAWFDGAVNCGFSAVAVHRRVSISLSWCRGRFSWSCLFGRPWRLRSCSMFPGGRCTCCAGRAFFPVVVTTGAHGSDSAEIRGGSTVAVPSQLWTSPYYAATSRLATVKVAQIQFIAGVSRHFQSPQRQVRTVAAVDGGPCLAGMVATFSCSLMQFCSIFRPPSIQTLRPRVAGTPGV